MAKTILGNNKLTRFDTGERMDVRKEISASNGPIKKIPYQIGIIPNTRANKFMLTKISNTDWIHKKFLFSARFGCRVLSYFFLVFWLACSAKAVLYIRMSHDANEGGSCRTK